MRDIMSLQKDPIEGIAIDVNPDDCKKLTAMIIGTRDTPYEDGMFFFSVEFPDQYPFVPPKVLFLNQNPQMRYHPNMYERGKVCLSILGTWSGPSWTSVQTLASVLLVLQSLFQEEPLRCEPGHENDKPSYIQRYNDIVEHEVIRCCYCLSPRTMRLYEGFKDAILSHLQNSRERMIGRVNELAKTDDREIVAPSPFSRIHIKTDYNSILEKVNQIMKQYSITGTADTADNKSNLVDIQLKNDS